MTTGQRCSCTSRVIVHDKIADEFTDRFYEAAKKLTIGHWSENPFMGPLINEAAVEKYVRFQEIAKRENCESLMRGKTLDLKYKGYYVTPSIQLVKKIRSGFRVSKKRNLRPECGHLSMQRFQPSDEYRQFNWLRPGDGIVQ